MKAEGLKYFTDAPIMIIGLLLFIFSFLGFIAWVNRRGSTELYRRISLLPLSETSQSTEDDHVAAKGQ